MKRKLDNLRRAVAKLSKRYGAGDVDVQRLHAELAAVESLERTYPERMIPRRTNIDFQTPAKRLYYAAAPHTRQSSAVNPGTGQLH